MRAVAPATHYLLLQLIITGVEVIRPLHYPLSLLQLILSRLPAPSTRRQIGSTNSIIHAGLVNLELEGEKKFPFTFSNALHLS